ncbi:unnamed protein product [Enterobius vermicularis]|uniref:Prefoldin subunit alpha n=1 Tax=Enterobius vermicularis TaxID=51028 RepID=A0A158QBF3_ENTVE|nr:unnamed protein product [Enterobius vermicularis]
MAEGGRNIEDYRKFVKERLEVDYQAVIKEINVINNEIKDYEILQLAISKITGLGIKKGLEMQVNIGKNIFCEANISNCERVVVKLGGDLFAELTLSRAEQFIEKRLEVLNQRAMFFEKEAHSIQARIHLILSSLDQLEVLDGTGS